MPAGPIVSTQHAGCIVATFYAHAPLANTLSTTCNSVTRLESAFCNVVHVMANPLWFLVFGNALNKFGSGSPESSHVNINIPDYCANSAGKLMNGSVTSHTPLLHAT